MLCASEKKKICAVLCANLQLCAVLKVEDCAISELCTWLHKELLSRLLNKEDPKKSIIRAYKSESLSIWIFLQKQQKVFFSFKEMSWFLMNKKKEGEKRSTEIKRQFLRAVSIFLKSFFSIF